MTEAVTLDLGPQNSQMFYIQAIQLEADLHLETQVTTINCNQQQVGEKISRVVSEYPGYKNTKLDRVSK